MRDVVHFLHGESPREEAAPKLDTATDAGALEREWRALYPVAVADFRRFLADWRRPRG